MTVPEDAVLLRIFLGENDRSGHQPLYQAIVLEARRRHLAGATVLRAALGFGQSSRLHSAKILRLSEDLPLVVEIVDAADKIESFLPELDRLMSDGSGLVTLEKVRVHRYGRGVPDGVAPADAG